MSIACIVTIIALLTTSLVVYAKESFVAVCAEAHGGSYGWNSGPKDRDVAESLARLHEKQFGHTVAVSSCSFFPEYC